MEASVNRPSFPTALSRLIDRNRTEIIGQTILYSTYGLLGLIQTYFEKGLSWREFAGVLLVTLVECLLVNLIANWLLVKYPFGKRPVAFFSGLFGLLLAYTVLRYYTVYPDFIDILNTYHGEQQPPTFTFFIFYQLINFVVSFMVGGALRLYKNGIRAERKARQLEHEVNEAQLAVLKYQINPHFLYNTLSYMYAQALPLSTNLAKSILILADMMRYALNKTDEQGRTSISKEINYIENFIEIHRLRFNTDFYVNFEIEGVINGRKILPMLLITFVENAFKHGKLTDPAHPVTIQLALDRNSLSFVVKNYKQRGIKDTTSGIGLENTKKRLQLAYPDQHTLIITEDASHFEIALSLLF